MKKLLLVLGFLLLIAPSSTDAQDYGVVRVGLIAKRPPCSVGLLTMWFVTDSGSQRWTYCNGATWGDVAPGLDSGVIPSTFVPFNALPVYARVTGSNVTTTGQSLVDITGLTVALTTNAIYEFEANLTVSTTAVTTGIKYGVNYSVAGGAVEATITGSLTSASDQTVRMSALNTATVAYLTTSAQSGGIIIKGIVTTGANAGNLTIQHLKVTSGTSTVFINSYLRVTRIS